MRPKPLLRSLLIKAFLLTFAIGSKLLSGAYAQNYDTNGGFVQTFAGFGEQGYVDGQGILTKFSNPLQIVSDIWSNLYVWDSGNHVVRKITADANVSTLAGGGNAFEGQGTNVSFSYYSSVGSMGIDHSNVIWLVAQFGSYPYLLTITPTGVVSIQNAGPTLTNLSSSSSICFDSLNNLYYSGGNTIYRYSPITYLSQPFAGNGTSGLVDGNGIVFPEFAGPAALTCDQANNIYVWDAGNYRIRRIDQGQNVTTIAGSPACNPYCNDVDGKGTNTSFAGNGVASMTADNAGNVYMACSTSVRKMDAQTNVVTLAGNFTQSSYTNGVPGNLARFNIAKAICLAQGMVFVADYNNQRIRVVTFNPTPQVVFATNLQLGLYPGLQIVGTVGRTYQIQTSPNLTNWTTRSTILLNSSPYLWMDPSLVGGNKFYRAVLLP
ncbi:MAG TPA: hypothetical protein VLT36_12055 [Candidatus Dormibacteraeota bacterium]|nr:hypothetical protein [Candidatus Dormibacteraeota bacterium]